MGGWGGVSERARTRARGRGRGGARTRRREPGQCACAPPEAVRAVCHLRYAPPGVEVGWGGPVPVRSELAAGHGRKCRGLWVEGGSRSRGLMGGEGAPPPGPG